MDENTLYYGDNLDILQRYIKDKTIDLVYLDPPFKSSQNYNILFKEKNGSQAASQIQAFEDTWTWSQEDEAIFADLVTKGDKVADCLQAFRTFLGPCDMLAYLVMMAPRLVELRRVTKPTASIYLHCDPAASHYLKMLMDAVFGPQNFLNEIVWKRTSAHSGANRWGDVHDVLLFYVRSDSYTWNNVYQSYGDDYLGIKYRYEDERGKYRLSDLTGAGTTQGDSGKPWRGYDPTALGRHWGVPRAIVDALIGREKSSQMTTQEKLDLIDANGYIFWTPRGKGGGAGFPQYKRYLTKGVPVQSVIVDIPPINSQAKERLGYPTQKPVALLERIISVSSNPGDIFLDPFCGCGTSVDAAQKLNRRWIGIDITHLAITLMKTRLNDAFGTQISYHVIGEPASLPDAQALAESDPYQFQYWALGLVNARPVEQKKGADKGIDGKIVFQGEKAGDFEHVIISVKAGHLMANHVRDLRGVLDREKAAIGVLISMEAATKPMHTEAVTAGFFESKTWGRKYPKIQLLTIADLLEGKMIDMPPIKQVGATFKKANKFIKDQGEQYKLPVKET